MAIKKLLVPLYGTPADDVAVATAALVATTWRAHMVAVYFYRATASIQALGPDIFPIGMINEMAEEAESERATVIQAAQARFAAACGAHGIAVARASRDAVGASGEFVLTTGREDEAVAKLARLADLTVLPHLNHDDDAVFADALHAALFDSGRPVLIAPPQPPAAIGTRICIAWNGTAESASGVQAVLPWLKRAQAVRVLTATGYHRRGPEAAALADYLALHEVKAEVTQFEPMEKSVGIGLLAAAQAFGADLLAMGAYSHPRWRQTILGGVTRTVLERAALPVLMSR
ncbi:MAG: universal stress protein [Acetobacteraceae bacterium]|nr:universal stress protein [Acetobacteraceae bacterium]